MFTDPKYLLDKQIYAFDFSYFATMEEEPKHIVKATWRKSQSDHKIVHHQDLRKDLRRMYEWAMADRTLFPNRCEITHMGTGNAWFQFETAKEAAVFRLMVTK